jgi:hypothetical protein
VYGLHSRARLAGCPPRRLWLQAKRLRAGTIARRLRAQCQAWQQPELEQFRNSGVQMRHIATPKWHRRLSAAPLAALMLTAAWPAMAQKGRFQYLLPPSEFDVPYTGKLTIWRVPSEKEMLTIFEGRAEREPNWLPIARAVGINRKSPGQPAPECEIYVVADDALKARRFSLSAALRHELGHCNGDLSHVGWKKVGADIPVTMPQLPESTRWLSASPSPCHPPSRRIVPCEGGY